MERRNGLFGRGAGRWNWADPSGYGVPGKPITQDQFYTADVFSMLVPDDGLSPVKESGWQPDRLRRPDKKADPGIEIDPDYRNDRQMELIPPTDRAPNPVCEDPERVQSAISAYRGLEHALEDSRQQLARAKNPAVRADLERQVRKYEEGLAGWRSEFERAITCTTPV